MSIQISIAIPTWERVYETLKSFSDVYDDERISEIVIVDDASSLEKFNELKELCDLMPKVKLYRNVTNQDCYRNKMTAISYATNDWCILLDSDNHIDKLYIDKLFEIKEWNNKTIYTPDFAKPTFDFMAYSGLRITKENVSEWIDKPMFETMLNAANYFVNKNEYLAVWDGSIDPVTSDSIYVCYKWLEAGNVIEVVRGLQYEHRVWSGSHYINNVHRTEKGFHEKILQNLREMI